jgi:hypothetical protein
MSLQRFLAVALLASAVLFAVGSQIERNTETGADAKAAPAEVRHDATGPHAPAGGQVEAGGKATEGAKPADTGESSSLTGAAKPAGAADAGASTEGSSSETPAQHRAEVHREAKLFGINPEAVGLVIAAVLASLALAAAVWLRRIPVVLLAIVGFGVVFAGFDVREVLHQIDQARASLIAIAIVLAALHALVAVLAGAELLRGRRRPTPPPALA